MQGPAELRPNVASAEPEADAEPLPVVEVAPSASASLSPTTLVKEFESEKATASSVEEHDHCVRRCRVNVIFLMDSLANRLYSVADFMQSHLLDPCAGPKCAS